MKKMKLNFPAMLLAVSFTACGGSGSGGDGPTPPPADKVCEMVVSAQRISTDYRGNGVQFSLYEHCFDADTDWGKNYNMHMDEAMWAKTFKRLDFMRPRLARTMISSKSFCYRGKDGQGNPIIDNDYRAEIADKWLDYCDEKDITVLWGEWGTGTIAPVTDKLWSKTVIGYADYLINRRNHSCIRYFIPCNEPDGNWTDATGGNFVTWKTALDNVHEEIEARNLQDKLAVAGPDACPGITGPTFIAYTANQANDKIGLWNIHIYPYPAEIRSGSYENLIRQWHGILGSDRQMVLGEVGMKFQSGTPEYAENLRRATEDPMGKSDTEGGSNMFVYDFSYGIDIADLYIQCMRGGISGGCSWIVCDAMNTSPGQKMKRWGMWNIFGAKMGNAADENIRPWYYTLSLLSRYFPKGCEILRVSESGAEGVRSVACIQDGKLSLAVVNNSKTARKVRFRLDAALGVSPGSMKEYRFFENDRPADNDQLPVPAATLETDFTKGIELELPAFGFRLLTSFDF